MLVIHGYRIACLGVGKKALYLSIAVLFHQNVLVDSKICKSLFYVDIFEGRIGLFYKLSDMPSCFVPVKGWIKCYTVCCD